MVGYRRLKARLGMAAVILPMFLGGAAPAIAQHAMTPQAGGLARYTPLGDASILGSPVAPCQIPETRNVMNKLR